MEQNFKNHADATQQSSDQDVVMSQPDLFMRSNSLRSTLTVSHVALVTWPVALATDFMFHRGCEFTEFKQLMVAAYEHKSRKFTVFS